MNDVFIVNWVRDNNIDLIINIRTRCIYKNEILNSPKFGCINVHHGILPKYRGTLCDLYALADSRPAGFTIHTMNEKIDDGDILLTCEVSDGKEKDYMKYLTKASAIEADKIAKIINFVANNHSLPKGRGNKADEVIYTKTPRSWFEIKSLKSKGMVL